MKQKLLLVSAAMLLAGSAFAAEWTKPTLTGQAVVTDGETEQYLYNETAGAFFLGANDWGTRGSLDPAKGYKMKIAETGEGTYSLTDYAESKKAWLKTFADSPTGIWVDNNSGANCDSWTITPAAGNSFVIANTAFEGMYLGPGADYPTDTRLYMTETSTTWISVGVEIYADFSEKMSVYNSAVALEKAIADAKAECQGIDLSAEEAVYNNVESTKEDLDKALEAVDKAVKDYVASQATANATWAEPVDMTAMIVNPSFETGDLTGWTCSKTNPNGFGDSGDLGAKANSNATYHCDNADGEYLFNVWAWGNPLTQVVENLPNGVYTLGAMVSSSDDCTAIYMLGSTGHKAVELETNPDDGRKQTWLTAGSMLVRVSDGTLLIGAAGCDADGKSYIEGGRWWYKADNFTLVYHGQSLEAYQNWAKSGDDRGIVAYGDDVLMTKSVREEYDNKIAAIENANTVEDILAAYDALVAYNKEVEANVEAWKKLAEAFKNAQDLTGRDDIVGEDFDALTEYIEFEAEDILTDLKLTTEEVIAETEKVIKMTNDAVANGLKEGSQLEIKNPEFAAGTTGWTFTAEAKGNLAANSGAKCAEAWNCKNFDIYQVVEGAPAGVYEISMQGFYREGRGENAWKLYFDEDGDLLETRPASKAFVYMNDAQTPIMNVFDYGVEVADNYYTGDYFTDPNGEKTYPNNMTDAGLAFDQGAYQVAAMGLVAAGEPMRIGVKGNSDALGDSWAIFTRFKLTFYGYNAIKVRSMLEGALADCDFSGVYGSDVKEEAQKALSVAQQAVGAEDGKAMVEALDALLKAQVKVEESKVLFAKLEAAVTEFGETLANSEAVAETKAEAAAYLVEVQGAYAGYTNAEAEEALEKMAALTKLLAIPAAAADASDENPVDMTSVLVSPSFEKNDADGNPTNSIDGWTCEVKPNFGNDATQKAALAVEYFQKTYDIYQDVDGLPNGVYTVSVNAFFRNGSSDQDFQSAADGEEGLAKMYAVTAEGTYTKAVTLLASGAQPEQIGAGNETAREIDEKTVYIPNDMVSAVGYFDAGIYLNELTVKVSDGKLRIGMKQEESITNGWMIMDNWTLTYYGENSEKTLDETTAITKLFGASASKVEFFNIGGQKVNHLSQGMNIVRTVNANGNVEIRKIFVK